VDGGVLADRYSREKASALSWRMRSWKRLRRSTF